MTWFTLRWPCLGCGFSWGKSHNFFTKEVFVKTYQFFTLWISKFQQMLNNWVNFWFSIMEKLWDLAQENLVNICTRYRVSHSYLDRAKNKKVGIVQSIQVMKLFFCQNDSLMGQSFWQNTSSVTHIPFELCLFWYLAQSRWLWDTL